MRYIGSFVIAILILIVASYSYLRHMKLDARGTTISQSIALARVQRTMVRIADAEGEQLTAFSECDSVDDLISGGKVDSNDKERAGYTFTIECDGGGAKFTVTARHAQSTPDPSLRWPELVMDQTKAVHAIY
jgi:hypothetical protein